MSLEETAHPEESSFSQPAGTMIGGRGFAPREGSIFGEKVSPKALTATASKQIEFSSGIFLSWVLKVRFFGEPLKYHILQQFLFQFFFTDGSADCLDKSGLY